MTQPLRVLFVEDQADLRELMADVLTGLGMDVHVAPDAQHAFDCLNSGRAFDVLFSDVYMPGHMTGAELSIRAARLFPQIRVVLASGHSRQQLPELPASVEFVQKPYSLSQVVDALRAARDGAPGSKA